MQELKEHVDAFAPRGFDTEYHHYQREKRKQDRKRRRVALVFGNAGVLLRLLISS